MKNLFSASLRSYPKCVTSHKLLNRITGYATLFLCLIFLISFLLSGCQKQQSLAINDSINKTSEMTMSGEEVMNFDEVLRKNYKNEKLSGITLNELLQVKQATAKYRNFDNAIKDGYADIGVIMPNMGYHYMKSNNVDDKFDFTKPELLVYNKSAHNNRMELLAAEFAVPIDLSPDTAPAGFSGDADVWDKNVTFGLWLLHAWVWSYNPDGVFNPTNPLVEVH